MGFYKISDSNVQNNEIIEVISEKTCDKCNVVLNLMKSKGGVIKCHKCGCENSVTENNE